MPATKISEFLVRGSGPAESPPSQIARTLQVARSHLGMDLAFVVHAWLGQTLPGVEEVIQYDMPGFGEDWCHILAEQAHIPDEPIAALALASR